MVKSYWFCIRSILLKTRSKNRHGKVRFLIRVYARGLRSSLYGHKSFCLICWYSVVYTFRITVFVAGIRRPYDIFIFNSCVLEVIYSVNRLRSVHATSLRNLFTSPTLISSFESGLWYWKVMVSKRFFPQIFSAGISFLCPSYISSPSYYCQWWWCM